MCSLCLQPSQLPDKAAKKIKEFYRSGQKVNCRIVGFNWFEGVVMLSMKTSTMENPHVGYHSITPGTIVEVCIEKVKGHLRDWGLNCFEGVVKRVMIWVIITLYQELLLRYIDEVKCQRSSARL